MADIVKWFTFVFFIGLGVGLFIGISTALFRWLFDFTKKTIFKQGGL